MSPCCGRDGRLGAKHGRPSRRELPLEGASLPSYLTYAWLDCFMWQAFRRGVGAEDVWKCPQVDDCQSNADRLETLWSEELRTRGKNDASLTRVFLRFVKVRLLVSGFLIMVAMALLLLVSGYLMMSVISYCSSPTLQLWQGVAFVVGLFFADLLSSLLFICVFTITHVAGIRLRAGALCLLYKKLLKLSSLQRKPLGQVVNLFANDSQRIFDGVSYLPNIVAAPVLILAVTGYSVYLLGVWALLGTAIMLFLIPLQGMIGATMMRFRAKCITFTDKRIRTITEFLQNVKYIKMNVWETPLSKLIGDVRHKEKLILEKINVAMSLGINVSSVLIAIATMCTLIGHTMTGNHLTVVQEILQLKDGVRKLALDDPSCKDGETGDIVIEVKRASLLWDELDFPAEVGDTKTVPDKAKQYGGDSRVLIDTKELECMQQGDKRNSREMTQPTLVDINLTVERGWIMGVTGSIGAGKSALITALLGQMTLLEGDIAIHGRIAYVPQQAWMLDATIRENIILDGPYVESRYEAILEMCCLKPDLLVLPAEDSTVVGPQGVNLSGGQKQRISLARALYADMDIYLLDDPLSSVDPDVADSIYQSVVQGILIGKTVLLVTHELKYLQDCDYIVYMEEGRIAEQGTIEDLSRSGDKWQQFVERSNANRKDSDVSKEEDIPGVISVLNHNTAEHNEAVKPSYTSADDKKLTSSAGDDLKDEEEREEGSVQAATYVAYTKAAGGWVVVCLMVLIYIVTEATVAFSQWWLAHWLGDGGGEGFMVNGNGTQKGGSISDNPSLPFYALVYGLSLLAVILFFTFRSFTIVKVLMGAASRIHEELFRRLLRCPVRFFDTTPLGHILNRFSKDMDELDSRLPPFIDHTMRNIVSIALYVAMIGYLIPWFLIGVPLFAVIFLLLYSIFRVGVREIRRLQNISMSPLLGSVTTTAQGLHCIHAYSMEDTFFKKFHQLLDHNSVVTLMFHCSMRWINVRMNVLTTFVVTVTAALVVILKGHIIPEYAGLVIVYAAQLTALFQLCVRNAAEIEARFTSMERINNYIKNLEEEAPLTVKGSSAEGTWPLKGHIKFDNYQMRYRPDLPLALKGISFEIQPRERIGIIGRTGAGKSSLAVALFRLVEPAGGSICVDSVDITRAGLFNLRGNLAIIPQEPILFAGTVRYNLDPFQRCIDQELWRALEQCHMKSTAQCAQSVSRKTFDSVQILEPKEFSPNYTHVQLTAFNSGNVAARIAFIESLVHCATEGVPGGSKVIISAWPRDRLIEVQHLEGQLGAPVTEKGQNFSVGERQLLSLARAMLRHCRIMIFDEATASIDSDTDNHIQTVIRNSFDDCTLLIIAHRLETIMNCDRLLVLDNGQVIKFDTPAALASESDFKLSQYLSLAMSNPRARTISSVSGDNCDEAWV